MTDPLTTGISSLRARSLRRARLLGGALAEIKSEVVLQAAVQRVLDGKIDDLGRWLCLAGCDPVNGSCRRWMTCSAEGSEVRAGLVVCPNAKLVDRRSIAAELSAIQPNPKQSSELLSGRSMI